MHNDLLVAQAEPNFGCAGSRLLAAVGSSQHLGEKARFGRPHWFRLFTNLMACGRLDWRVLGFIGAVD
jgi:hypothetical protein